MPLPLNQKRKRGWIGPAAVGVAAYAVPFVLNIATSGGRPTRIAAPVMLRLLRKRRLLSGIGLSCGGRLKPATTDYRLKPAAPGPTHGSAPTACTGCRPIPSNM